MNRFLEAIRAFDGVLELAPAEGGPYPEIAWGDHFFYYAPDREVPRREQPYATIITKDYPGDTACDLDPPGRWRLNVHVGRDRFTDLIGADPRDDTAADVDFAAADVVLPHPVYRAQGWVAIVAPGIRTYERAVGLAREAHDTARRRAARRGAP